MSASSPRTPARFRWPPVPPLETGAPRPPHNEGSPRGEGAPGPVSNQVRIPFLAYDSHAVCRAQAGLVAALAGVATLADELAGGLAADPAELARRCGHLDATLGRFLAALEGQGDASAGVDDVAAAFAHKAAANAGDA